MSSRGCRVEIDKVGRDEWASLLGLFDDRTIMQSWEFGEAICPGQEPSRIVVRSARGEVVAMTQVRMVRLPWVRAGMAQVAWGPLWRRRGESLDWNALEAALAALRDEYAVRRGLLLRIAPNIEADEGSRTGEVLARVGYRRTEAIRACRTIYVDLTRPLEAIRSSFTQPGRYSLRAAERKGVAVREGTSPALFDELAPLYDELLERKALRSWLDLGRWRRLQGLLPEPERPRIFVAHHGGKPVAGSVVSALGSTGYCIFLATGPEGRKLLASYLLQWRAMTWLKERGCRAYDLAGITPDEAPGTYPFKKAFGGRELSPPRGLASCSWQ